MSWNYSQTTKTLSMAFPKIDFSRFRRSRTKETDEKETAFVNLDSPNNQSEVIKIRRTDIPEWKSDKTVRTAYPPSSKKGYSLSISDYASWRSVTADGDVYDNPIKVTISLSATDGTAETGGLLQGADWVPHINRAYAFLLSLLYDTSDDAMTLLTDQDQLDSIMHGSTDLINTVETQA